MMGDAQTGGDNTGRADQRFVSGRRLECGSAGVFSRAYSSESERPRRPVTTRPSRGGTLVTGWQSGLRGPFLFYSQNLSVTTYKSYQ